MLRITLFVLLSLLSYNTFAQRGRVGMLEFAVGGRVGAGIGITGQYFYTDHHVIEAIVSSRWKGLSTTLLYEHHMSIRDVRGLKWYLGAGAHGTIYPVGTNRPDLDNTFAGQVFVPGVDAILGLEYFFPGVPVQISFDLKPEYNFGILNRPDFTNGGVSLRYRF
jgi:hypothetical protein